MIAPIRVFIKQKQVKGSSGRMIPCYEYTLYHADKYYAFIAKPTLSTRRTLENIQDGINKLLAGKSDNEIQSTPIQMATDGFGTIIQRT